MPSTGASTSPLPYPIPPITAIDVAVAYISLVTCRWRCWTGLRQIAREYAAAHQRWMRELEITVLSSWPAVVVGDAERRLQAE